MSATSVHVPPCSHSCHWEAIPWASSSILQAMAFQCTVGNRQSQCCPVLSRSLWKGALPWETAATSGDEHAVSIQSCLSYSWEWMTNLLSQSVQTSCCGHGAWVLPSPCNLSDSLRCERHRRRYKESMKAAFFLTSWSLRFFSWGSSREKVFDSFSELSFDLSGPEKSTTSY